MTDGVRVFFQEKVLYVSKYFSNGIKSSNQRPEVPVAAESRKPEVVDSDDEDSAKHRKEPKRKSEP
jgi:hypothetical protein